MNACFPKGNGAKLCVCTKLQNTLLFFVSAVASFGRDPLKWKLNEIFGFPFHFSGMPYPYSSEECCDLTNYIYLLEPSWGKIIYWMVVHGTNVERWKRSALNFAVYSTALTVTALCALQEQMKLFHGIVSKVEKVKSVSFLSGKKILRSGLLLCGILEEGLFGSNFPVILFLVEAARKTRHQIVTSLFQNKHNQQEENIF